MNFTDTEIYAIARCLKGMEWKHLPLDPLLAHLLGNVKAENNQQVKTLFDLLGTNVLTRVFAVDPSKELEIAKPAPKVAPLPVDKMPDLPDHVKLTAAQE